MVVADNFLAEAVQICGPAGHNVEIELEQGEAHDAIAQIDDGDVFGIVFFGAGPAQCLFVKPRRGVRIRY